MNLIAKLLGRHVHAYRDVVEPMFDDRPEGIARHVLVCRECGARKDPPV